MFRDSGQACSLEGIIRSLTHSPTPAETSSQERRKKFRFRVKNLAKIV